METPMVRKSLNRAITPHVRDPDEREAIYHFLTLVNGHGTPVESWLTRTRIQGFDDLVAISLDFGMLKDGGGEEIHMKLFFGVVRGIEICQGRSSLR